MTARQAYINILIELVKEEAPTLYLEDYLYYFNKAISEYMKARYELYEVDQQLADDLRFWKKDFVSNSPSIPIDSIFVAVGAKRLFPYRHLLSCIIDVHINKPITKCDQRAGTTQQYKVTRMSAEIKAAILNNSYLRPTFYRPYFEIRNNSILINAGDFDPSRVSIKKFTVEYLCQPTPVVLTEVEVEAIADTSQVLEFSDDVCDEITKVALKLILERGSNPRMQSNVAVNQSISDMPSGMRGGK
jgi:hypothetical protein